MTFASARAVPGERAFELAVDELHSPSALRNGICQGMLR
jgi:hypothetical protein